MFFKLCYVSDTPVLADYYHTRSCHNSVASLLPPFRLILIPNQKKFKGGIFMKSIKGDQGEGGDPYSPCSP